MSDRFVCLLGIDGSGKTSILNALASRAPEYTVIDWHPFVGVSQIPTFPPGLHHAEVLERLGSHSRAALLLYFVSLEFDLLIRPAVAEGRAVIVDSYWYKFAAKERVIGIAPAYLYEAYGALPHPRKVVFLDTPPEVAFGRKKTFTSYEARGGKWNFVPFQAAVRAEMLRLISDLPHVILDGCLPPPELAALLLRECSLSLSCENASWERT